MSLTLPQIRIIEAICRTGAVGAAARDLGVSQPTVSAQLRQIEDRYHLRLFQREGHRMLPGPVALSLLPRMRAALALVGEMETMLDRTSSLDAGRLSIGYSTHQFVMSLLSAFIARHPGLRIEARSQASADLLDLLRRGEIEAAFVTLPAPDPDLTALELRRDRIVLMMPVGHPLLARDALDWADVATVGLIRREASSGTRIVFDRAAQASGLPMRHLLDLGSWESLRGAVIEGIGCGIAMDGEIDPADTQISALPIRDPALEVGHFLVCLPEMRNVAPVAALFALTAQHFPQARHAKQ
ncbi:LysR family transcriptional regulator [Meridianimarinicoccus sp. RP-17]|uniref:LysR family transcriptional regulator n=1 Tax=Meridianimarinicoccus zhengii TaxID=2056810 RepID=UPI0013A6B6E0|nr:LysR family transcriptional regulator [Phycocomes zhengii]